MSNHCQINPTKCPISPKNALLTNAKFSRLKSQVTEPASAYGALVLEEPCKPKAGWRKTSAGKCLLHSTAKLNIRCGGSCSWLCAYGAQHKPLFLSKVGFILSALPYWTKGLWLVSSNWHRRMTSSFAFKSGRSYGSDPTRAHWEEQRLLFFYLEKATEGTCPAWETWL